jgi:hypothetical protein
VRPSEELLDAVERILGSRAVTWLRPTGGYSIAERWSLDLADGRRVFAKRATTDDLAGRIRDEYRNMSAIEADFRCDVIAWEDGDRPLLLLEDLRDGRWPPPWEVGDLDRVLRTLERMAAMPIPGFLPDAESLWREGFSGWQDIRRDPAPFLGLGIATEAWLEECIEPLIDAEKACVLDGDDLLHMDVRSDNLCLLPDRVVLVDWNWACRGRAAFEHACLAPALRLEGGPLPDEIVADAGADAAAVAGFFAAKAGLPISAGAPTVRKFQLRQVRIALPWACRELGLPQPDIRWAMDEIARADDALRAGEIDEAEWHVRIEEPLIDAYLSSDDPRAQSGKGGDEEDWRWGRELILDVFPARATFLDVGCANGYLMESIARWGAERGIDVEPYGLDISWRIASLAKHRLPQWTDRIFIGNAIDWTPPRRFDVVQAGLDEVPPPRRRELVDRLLREFLVPGGRLVFRAGRVGAGLPDVVEQLDDIGIRPEGVIERPHPHSGQLRRTAWLTAPVA